MESIGNYIAFRLSEEIEWEVGRKEKTGEIMPFWIPIAVVDLSR